MFVAEIRITIDTKSGAVTGEGIGFEGGACSLPIHQLLASLGTVVAQEYKPEFYDDQVVAESTLELEG